MSISQTNIEADFIAYENVTADRLKSQLVLPQRTKAGLFILCRRGNLKLAINFTDYRIAPNCLIAIPPETFVQVLAASHDLQLHIIVFSQKLIQNAILAKDMIDRFRVIGKHYVLPLSYLACPLYEEMFALLIHLHKDANHLLSHSVMQSLLNLTLQGVSELCPEQAEVKEVPGTKNFEQYRIFIRLAHTFYISQHQVAFYAKEMKMKQSTLCRLVKKESGSTPMEIINDALIMDAKTQLRTSGTPVKDIALSLGFNNAAFFNKFFKRHVGITPQMFRKSKN